MKTKVAHYPVKGVEFVVAAKTKRGLALRRLAAGELPDPKEESAP